MRSSLGSILFAALFLLVGSGCNFDSTSSSDDTGGSDPIQPTQPTQPSKPAQTHPNILFVVLDDVGVDQFEAFGYGGETKIDPPADVASIDAIANDGVRFRNTWSMPTCSTTRAALFSGRYPFRNGVMNAITSSDLANSQLSPYETTTPKLLKASGYVSALIGKIHVSGSPVNPHTNPMGTSAMRDLGWDYFAGYEDGGPYPIDTTAGGVAPQGTYQCGFVPNTTVDPVNGADTGVCYLPDGNHTTLSRTSAAPSPGRTCVEQGGIFDPSGQPYSEDRRAELDFDTQNAYYVSEWIIDNEDGSDEVIPPSDPAARGYRSTLETDRAIDWIKTTRENQSDKPWMLTIGYSAIHTPLQPPPASLLPNPLDPDNQLTKLDLVGCGTPVADKLSELGGSSKVDDLAAFAQSRAVTQHALEAVDHELGRLLEETGIATRGDDGNLHYNPDSNTVVVIVGDNGTFAPSVKLPFDYNRAKGTPYQTGVWVPLIVAGPADIVTDPDRDVESMVNTTDLYSLFAEVAGIDMTTVSAHVDHPLDAKPVMPYLQDPGQAEIRDANFTEVGLNIAAETPPPCVIPSVNTCVQIFPQKEVCEDQGGVWYGDGNKIQEESFGSCCAVIDYLVNNPGDYEGDDPNDIVVFPKSQQAMRNDQYKLVSITRKSCATGKFETTDEFYAINESKDPDELKLDKAEDNLLAGTTPDTLTDEQQANYDDLKQKMNDLLATKIACPGDGNGDLKVDQQDLVEWKKWSTDNGWGYSSWYDLNHDGLTDDSDKQIITQNLGNVCSA